MTNLMIDLETLGTRPGCAILSIAAVPFASPYDIEPFYVKVDQASCDKYDFHVDAATIEWWSKQSKEAYDEAFSGITEIKVALFAFEQYCAALPTPPVVWGNGADFDNAVLAEAYKLVGIKQPWRYTDSRCYRTLKALYSQIPFIKPTIAHNALQDAKAQADHATRIFSWIGEKGR